MEKSVEELFALRLVPTLVIRNEMGDRSNTLVQFILPVKSREQELRTVKQNKSLSNDPRSCHRPMDFTYRRIPHVIIQ